MLGAEVLSQNMWSWNFEFEFMFRARLGLGVGIWSNKLNQDFELKF